LDVDIAPRGTGRTRPTAVPDPDDLPQQLEDLYVHQRLSSTQIAKLLGLPDRRIRARLHQYGIRRRSTGPYHREDRHDLDPQLHYQLAVLGNLSALEVSQVTGSAYQIVLRSAHAFGLPVRLGGNAPRSGAASIQLLDALYNDPQVIAALATHNIPMARSAGPLWDRFPVPARLSAGLLTTLYLDCGLAIDHIELVTGQPTQTIHRQLLRHRIPLRAPGQRSPFRRRWHQTNVNKRPATGPGACVGLPVA